MPHSRRVMKFGGTSLADPERIRAAADLVRAEAQKGPGVAVVVSAMAGETDRLIGLAETLGGPIARGTPAYDAAASSGELASAGLMALALEALGFDAEVWPVWRLPLRTDAAHGQARILTIDADAMGRAIDVGGVAVMPGFQGVTAEGRLTTLGRGGTDTSAVALAAALDAERCDIFTDVDGVYTTDPRLEKRARRLDRISYEEMLELASLGAKVLQTRSVELAMAHGTRLRVLSSFIPPGGDNPGTLVTQEDKAMEKRIVSGVAYSRDEARVTLLGLPNRADALAAVFARLGEANVNVDMIVRGQSRGAEASDLTFTVGHRDLERAAALVSEARETLGFEGLETETDLAKVSVVGVGMRSHAGVAQILFAALAERGVEIDAVATSEIKISALIPADSIELAVRALHAAYGLDAR